MAPLEQSEKDELTARILQQLSKTPYACSSLTQLTNGTTNFVFRGTLTQPLRLQNRVEEGTGLMITKTVVLKHYTAFAALNKDLPIDISRCVISSFNISCRKEPTEC
jgi:hypothetical protein